MNIINNVKENKKFIASELMILISNSFLYFSAGMLILRHVNEGMYQGLFTALVAIFNFIFAFTLYKSDKADRNLIYLLIGLVLTFVSLIAPVQLKGNYITLFWATEAVLLLWLSQKSGISLIKTASVVITVLMLGSLLIDWTDLYIDHYEAAPVLVNKGFITGMVCVLSLCFSIRLLKGDTSQLMNILPAQTYKTIVSIVALIFAYWAGLFELTLQLDHHLHVPYAQIVYTGIYHFILAFLFVWYAAAKKTKALQYTSIVFTTLCCFYFATLYLEAVPGLRNNYLTTVTVYAGHYYVHYLLSILLLALLWFCYRFIRAEKGMESQAMKTYLWLSSVAVLFIVSAEGQNILMPAFYKGGGLVQIHQLQKSFFQIAYPLIWGICSFAAMYIGLRKKIKTYRIISLVVFFITLLKLFIFDVTRMSEGGKIAAFISLGILLLIISFMYQKLKKIIIEDDVQKS